MGECSLLQLKEATHFNGSTEGNLAITLRKVHVTST
jgi:hypothetical protein